MSSSAATETERLFTPVQYLKGVGPQRAALLRRLGLRTAVDVLFYFPRDYEAPGEPRSIDKLEEGVTATVTGVIEDVEQRSTAAGPTMLAVLLREGNNYLRGVWFNQPFLRKQFAVGQRWMFSGKARFRMGHWEMAHPRTLRLATDDDQMGPKAAGSASSSLQQRLPVYPLTEGLNQYQMREIVRRTIEAFAPLLEETFSADYREAHDLLPIAEAVQQVHFPDDEQRLSLARRRFVYQELLLLELALAVQRHQYTVKRRAAPLGVTPRIDARIRRLFPFELTGDQQRAIEQIAADMGREVPMNRLLQGEVGSGKTVVALYAMLLAVAHGHQAVLMAPTEVLAQQHANTIGRTLRESRVRTTLLTGSLSRAVRGKRIEAIGRGEVDLVIGTQAVVQESVEFARLGLVVIDEQHKFGVRQRATLKHAGPSPHYLVMTATPIPRTVTMTVFGDLDVSILRKCPPGRQPVHTYLVSGDERKAWWDFFRRKLSAGRQGYVVTPLVEESSTVQAANLEATFEELTNGALHGFRVGMLHGRMPPREKAAVMEAFREGELQVLVATTVVEVGLDVPRATLMTIESGQRFGLAQLHQLRGRIARGSYPGFCCVFCDGASGEARERLEAFASTTDGFRLAEIDLELRGPGDLLGVRQHGVPPLRIADLVHDRQTLEEARSDAIEIVARDPGLRDAKHQRLRRMLLHRYGQVLELGLVG